MIAANLPLCTSVQSTIIQLRKDGASYRDIAKVVKLNPRKVRDQEIAAMRKIVPYLEKQVFLEPIHAP